MSYPPLAPSPKLPSPPSMTASEEPAKLSTKPSKKSRKKASKSSKHSQAPKTIKKVEKSVKADRLHRRSRSGCFTCRLRRKKCDEEQPICRACKHLKLKCEYEQPNWWNNNDQRRSQKDYLKDLIKNTRLSEKEARRACCSHTPPPLSHSAPTPPETCEDSAAQTRDTTPESPDAFDREFRDMHDDDSWDPCKSQVQTPHPGSQIWSSAAPYEVDIKTESELFVNDIPTRRDSTISTFSTFQPPLAHTMLPSFVGDDWMQRELFEPRSESDSSKDSPTQHGFGFSQPPVCAPAIHVEDADRHLLDHFFENVSRLIFPVLEARQRERVYSDVILPAIESNKCYLHCCLSTAAVHMKATKNIGGDLIDKDILKHRYQAVSELCKALNQDVEHLQILEATLGMTFFQCSVGRVEDTLPDIAWHQHFQAATSLIQKLDLTGRLLETDQGNVHPPFNMSLAAWIDILGSTMLGQMPQFAHTYRTKLFGGSSAGLCELMGCDDRIMYLIAEISCLDALKLDGRVDHLGICGHVTNLAEQLDHTEPPAGSLVSAISEDGVLQPQQLSKNMTALFRVAARLYLCSLVPGFHCNQENALTLVANAAELLDLIPAGPDGFDRSLVWPLLICSSFSTPTSSFRQVLTQRIERLGEQAQFGSFGRMSRVVQEVWRLGDIASSAGLSTTTTMATMATTAPAKTARLPTPVSTATTPERILRASHEGQPQGYKHVHWRDVMKQNGWEFLLI